MNDRHASRCDNCETPLVGAYCHICGQHAHNPLRSFRHAVEDVFESFWHLDGRIFRTLRDLLVPGRVAKNYLDGRRVAYVPPLRLFVILSLLTFFIGKLTIHVDPVPMHAANPDGTLQTSDIEVGESSIRSAATVDAVLKARTDAFESLGELRDNPFGQAMLSMLGPNTEQSLHETARKRLIELKATPAQLRAAGYEADKPWTPSAQTATAIATDADAAFAPAPGEGWFSRWLKQRGERMRQNANAIRKDPDMLIKLILGAVPGALLMLMPVFALFLKLLYIRSGRGFLEHLVVAMYSHIALLCMLLVNFIALGLGALVGGSAMAVATNAFAVVLFGFAAPAYLLWMQKRVYAQGWIKTLAKYAILGSVYTVLLGCALIYAVLAGISS
jgi:hypothetical protein